MVARAAEEIEEAEAVTEPTNTRQRHCVEEREQIAQSSGMQHSRNLSGNA
jgi:hypothetical protein